MGFWWQNPHSAYNANDTIANIIHCLKQLYKTTVQLTESLNAEITARKAADDVLQSNIDSETNERTNADNALSERINTETAERKAADYDITYTAVNTSININKGVD